MVIILRGPSGAGKSTVRRLLESDTWLSDNDTPLPRLVWQWASKIWDATRDMPVSAFSSDSYHMHNGVYRYEPSRLSTSHNLCLRAFTEAITAASLKRGGGLNGEHALYGDELLIVDNTNTTIAEIAPYAALACAFNHELHIGTLLADPAIAHARNVHEVPITNVVKQCLQLEQSILAWPKWWPQAVMPV